VPATIGDACAKNHDHPRVLSKLNGYLFVYSPV